MKNKPIILLDEFERNSKDNQIFGITKDMCFGSYDLTEGKHSFFMTICYGHCRENEPNFIRDRLLEEEKEREIEKEHDEISELEENDIIDCPGEIERYFEICPNCGKKHCDDEVCDCEKIDEPEIEIEE